LRESGAGYLLLALGITSALLLTVDINSRLLDPVRSTLSSVVSPIYVVAETPYSLSRGLGQTFAARETLQAENEQLRRRVLELSQVSAQFVTMRDENARLRELLGSRRRLGSEVLVAELIGVIPTPNTLQVEIDKGSQDGAYVGQAVIDAEGIFGQVVEVGAYTSRVMLIADVAHAVPVEVNRNQFRSIAAGTGAFDALELEYVPITTDIVTGDVLVSSGLGGRFPRGYPVAVVTSVRVDPTLPYAQVRAKPLAALDRSRHVLLVFEIDDVSGDVEETQAEDAAADDSASTGETP